MVEIFPMILKANIGDKNTKPLFSSFITQSCTPHIHKLIAIINLYVYFPPVSFQIYTHEFKIIQIQYSHNAMTIMQTIVQPQAMTRGFYRQHKVHDNTPIRFIDQYIQYTSSKMELDRDSNKKTDSIQLQCTITLLITR